MTKLICRKRGRGKTLKLIQECYYRNLKDGKTNTCILVADLHRALWLNDFAKKKKYNIPFPLTVWDIIGRDALRGTTIRHILVDDVEDVLVAMISRAGVDIPTITMTKEKTELI